ncbi:MAG TPA: sugar ABC transporter permease [Pseudonocardiaceae bacterium]|nr:sugar ABC transporter permease [Pseudonocardiaceae bacterium]
MATIPADVSTIGGVETLAAPRKRRRSAQAGGSKLARRGNTVVAWLFILPALVGFATFYAYPTLRGIYLSFTEFHVLSPPQWVGLANFVELVHDSVFWHSLLVTVYFVILSVVFGLIFSLVTAVIMNRIARSTIIRGVVLLPFLISGVVAAMAWSWMLDSQLGIVNIVLEKLFGTSVQFLGSSTWAIPSLALINVWKWTGYFAILIFAGLQTIPTDVYEAAGLDGASEVQMFRRITVPLLRPVLIMVVILNVIGSFQVFDIVSVTTEGGPANASLVLQMYIYSKAFAQFDFGYAATMSLALFVMLIFITFMQLRLGRANESDTN